MSKDTGMREDLKEEAREEEAREEEAREEEAREVGQARLDQWRAYAEQTRTDMFTVRQLVAGGQREAAVLLLGSVIEQSIIAGLDMEGAGAARPAHLPPIPAPGTVSEVYDDSDD